MLSQLDTVIGFVVVMSIVSLLIMVITQICSSFLGLRGKNLADALETLFHKLEPNIHVSGCKNLIDQALTNPVISDSILSVRKKEGLFVRWFPYVRTLRLRWMRATAVRPDELLDLLHETASGPVATALAQLDTYDAVLSAALHFAPAAAAPPAADPMAQVRTAADAVAAARNAAPSLTPKLRGAKAAPQGPVPFFDLVKTAFEAYGRVAADPQTAALLGPAASTAPAVLLKNFTDAWNDLETEAKRKAAVTASVAARQIVAAIAAKVMLAANNAGAQATAEVERFEKWFNSAQDRAQQWFSMHARLITVVSAVLAAFVLQLDTIQLVRVLSSNPDVRAKLVAQADALQQQAESAGQALFSAKIHARALAAVRSAHPDWNIPAGLDTLPYPGADFAKAGEQLSKALADDPNRADILAAYSQEVDRERLGLEYQNLSKVAALNSSGPLQLMPDPYPVEVNGAWSWKQWYAPVYPWSNQGGVRTYWSWPPHHLFGILLSAALLSLGGPFWFSLLKQLSSLRPALADSVDSQPKQQASKNGGS